MHATYSTRYVAQRLGVSVPTIQRWVDAGRLLAWKTKGGHRRIDAASAEALFREFQMGMSTAPEGATAPDADRRPSFVVVDDNIDDRELLAALCDEAFPGAQVTLAENGFVGLLAVGQLHPDGVITDVVMPNMDGIEMLRQLHSAAAVQPRILVATSSRSPERLFERTPLPEGVAFIPKPIDAQRMVKLLREALTR